MMDVYEAVRSRHSVRAFTDRPVPREALCRVLSEAAWAPSGSNIKPWRVYAVTGAPLTELTRLAGERVAAGDPWDEREYEMYPAALPSPYRERKSAFGEQCYGRVAFTGACAPGSRPFRIGVRGRERFVERRTGTHPQRTVS
jgi:nitroreductase